jgi:hypothetical protein
LRSAAAVFVVVLIAGCGSSATRSGSAGNHQVKASSAGGQPSTPASTPVRPSPGSLPQTSQLPSSSTAGFQAEMASLWQGIRSGSVSAAMPAFFPEEAYAQVKAIADPRADYNNRLVHEFAQDIAAAHGQLGASAPSAQLVGVQVPSSYAHWVSPGACYNGVGYYEVPNARVVYRQGGQTSSFGIASMISWRGVWYVVHLGSVTRSSDAGVVDDPSSGTGSSAPSSTC